MGSYSISSNAKEVAANIRKISPAIQKELEQTIKKTAKDIRTTLYGYVYKELNQASVTAIASKSGRSSNPFTITKGRLRASFTQSPKKAGDAIFKVTKYDARIGTTVPYMKYLEDGTPSHIITPKNKRVLRFFDPEDGIIFTKEVHHPGTKPYKIFARTRMMYRKIYPDRIKLAVKRGLNK